MTILKLLYFLSTFKSLLVMTCSHLFHNLYLTCFWMVHDLLMTCSWHGHHLFIISFNFFPFLLLKLNEFTWITSLTLLYLTYFPYTTSLELLYLRYLTSTTSLFHSKCFIPTIYVGTIFPTMIARTKISLAAVPTTLLETAVTAIFWGIAVSTMLAGTKNFFV